MNSEAGAGRLEELYGLTPPSQQQHEAVGQQAAHGDGQDPGPNHMANNAPFDGAESFGRADTHDRGGNDMRSRQRDPPMCGHLNDPRRSGLSGEAMDRLHLDYLVAERPDNSPTAD